MYWARGAAVEAEQLIRLLSHCSNFKHIQQAHGFMIPSALIYNNFLLNRFIHLCSSLGFPLYAFSVFNSISHPPDLLLFNSMIKSLSSSSSSNPQASIFLFNSIQLSGFRPDSYSFPFVLKAVVRLSAIDTGKQLHSQTIRIGLHSDVHVATALIKMYSSFHISDARKVFDEMSLRTRYVAMWNAMVAGYAKLGDIENARVLSGCMPEKDVFSWTALISGHAQMDMPQKAIEIFREMQLQNVEPDEITMLAVLSACANLGALELGEWIHNYMNKFGLRTTVSLDNALIDMYSKSGNIRKALEVFENMQHKCVVTWSTIIAGLASHGLGREALEMFSRMERAGLKPNGITFVAVLSACCHIGLVQIGKSYFCKMRLSYGIEPKIQHYGCMIDLLGRAGYLREAEKLIESMPLKPNAAIWGSLLAASYTHGEPMLGARALRHLIELEPNNSGNYAILSNIYASHGMWKESRIVRKMMRDKGVKKIPGGSFIELNNRVSKFTSGETLHPQFDEICTILCNINRQLRPTQHFKKECIAIELLQYGE